MPETVAEPWEYMMYIPHDLRAVTVSRRTVRLILTLHGLIRLTDVAELVAAELVSNAVRHTKGQAALRVRWRAGVLRIGAWDADPRPRSRPCRGTGSPTRRRGAASPSCGPAPTCGAGSRWPGTGSAASTCGVTWLPRSSLITSYRKEG